ncbi:hypothetical protein IW144_001811, partial [Coemansia sp. RSA 522]
DQGREQIEQMFLAVVQNKPASGSAQDQAASEDHDAQYILREFRDVFAKPPAGLPPKHNIDHCIDLLPNARPQS